MSRASNYRQGPWTKEEDKLLRIGVEMYGEGSWRHIPSRTGLNRCRKSCRLRWLNYLRPNIKKGNFAVDEVDLMMRLHRLLGNRWTLIAGRIPGRTANDVKNFWNSQLSKKLMSKQNISSSCKDKLHETENPKTNSRWLRRASQSSSSKQPPREGEEDDGDDEEGEEEEEATSSFWRRMLIKGEEMEINSTNLQVEKKGMVSAEDDFFVGSEELLQEMDMELWDVFGSHQGQQ